MDDARWRHVRKAKANKVGADRSALHAQGSRLQRATSVMSWESREARESRRQNPSSFSQRARNRRVATIEWKQAQGVHACKASESRPRCALRQTLSLVAYPEQWIFPSFVCTQRIALIVSRLIAWGTNTLSCFFISRLSPTTNVTTKTWSYRGVWRGLCVLQRFSRVANVEW